VIASPPFGGYKIPLSPPLRKGEGEKDSIYAPKYLRKKSLKTIDMPIKKAYYVIPTSLTQK
jgi:hypothetical protein